jgi:dolichyl-phosphate-mannose--protein O-mannosyl transferase
VPTAILMRNGDFQTPFSFSSSTNQANIDWLHPPLAKYFQALSITLFGITALAWRLPSLIFSLLTLVVFYFLVRFLGQNFFFKKESNLKKIDLSINLALTACFFLSLDGLFLVQSRIAMNDIFVLFFTLMAIFIYVIYLANKKSLMLLVSGALFGLALASKWSALWILLFLLIKELLMLKSIKKIPFLLFSLLLTPIFVYLLVYLPMFWQGQNLGDFLVLQKTILLSQLTNPSTHLYSSNPLVWILNLRPVWYFTVPISGFWSANIYALDNPLLGLYMMLAFFMSIWFLLKHKLNDLAHKSIYFIFLLYLSSFLPWIIFSRTMFFYHYLLAIPFLLILLSYFVINYFNQIKNKQKKRALMFNLLFWPFFFFIIFYPHWTALPVPKTFIEAVYFFLPSWR